MSSARTGLALLCLTLTLTSCKFSGLAAPFKAAVGSSSNASAVGTATSPASSDGGEGDGGAKGGSGVGASGASGDGGDGSSTNGDGGGSDRRGRGGGGGGPSFGGSPSGGGGSGSGGASSSDGGGNGSGGSASPGGSSSSSGGSGSGGGASPGGSSSSGGGSGLFVPKPAANWSFTWVSGSHLADQPGVYGERGVSSPGCGPGGRTGSAYAVDREGNLWLFGGSGVDAFGDIGKLDDLWKFDGETWTWVSGDKLVNQKGSFGQKGVPALHNHPPARVNSMAWVDPQGRFWLFGGIGPENVYLYLNDLWVFDGQYWTWISGDTLDDVVKAMRLGVQGIASTPDSPGSRMSSASWTDSRGIFWLFGGLGVDTRSNIAPLGDLWKFDGERWTQVSSVLSPAGRYDAITWTSATGERMLFGGYGNSPSGLASMGDLWKFDGESWLFVDGPTAPRRWGYPCLLSWADGQHWVTSVGSDLVVTLGFFRPILGFGDWSLNDPFGGTYVGVPVHQSTAPEEREGAITWIDSQGRYLLFGGLAGWNAYKQDVWQYNP